MKLALNTLMWHDEPLPNVLGYAAELGVALLDLGALPGVGHLPLSPDEDVAEACTEVRRAIPKTAQVVAVTADHCGLAAGDEALRREGVAYTVAAMRAAEVLGAPVVGTSLGSVGPGRTWDDAADCATQSIREAMASSPAGLRLAIEIHVADVCNSVDKAEAILGAVDHPSVGVTFDTSLLFHNRIDVGEAFRRLGKRIFHVHLRGATSETYFAIPGRDEVEFGRLFSELRRIGYQGCLALELYEVPQRYGISTLEAARESLSYLRGLLAGC